MSTLKVFAKAARVVFSRFLGCSFGKVIFKILVESIFHSFFFIGWFSVIYPFKMFGLLLIFVVSLIFVLFILFLKTKAAKVVFARLLECFGEVFFKILGWLLFFVVNLNLLLLFFIGLFSVTSPFKMHQFKMHQLLLFFVVSLIFVLLKKARKYYRTGRFCKN